MQVLDDQNISTKVLLSRRDKKVVRQVICKNDTKEIILDKTHKTPILNTRLYVVMVSRMQN